MLRHCEAEQLTFTRGRVGRKNDNLFVEQKNWSIIRRLVGYLRYDSKRHLSRLHRLYATYRLYTNFFLPVFKAKLDVVKLKRELDELLADLLRL